MLARRHLFNLGLAGLVTVAVSRFGRGNAAKAAKVYEINIPDAEWHKRLTPDQYEVLRRDGTEQAFTSPLLHEKRSGQFACAGCGQPLFSSETKFDSGTGWPSFWAPLDNAVSEAEDNSYGMARTAVSCHRCGGHLGHVFNDGPKPTGLRYCMNGVAMSFIAAPV